MQFKCSISNRKPILRSRKKHIEIDLYFVRWQVLKGKLKVNNIPATYQCADTITKALSARNFIRFKSELNIEKSSS